MNAEAARDRRSRQHANIDRISTSEIKISVVIDLAKGEPAMKAIHAAFIG
jgi:aspartokinase